MYVPKGARLLHLPWGAVVTTPQSCYYYSSGKQTEKTIERTKTQPWCMSEALRILADVPRKITQGVPHSKHDSKLESLGFESIPKQASRSCWLCGLSARSPGNLPPS